MRRRGIGAFKHIIPQGEFDRSSARLLLGVSQGFRSPSKKLKFKIDSRTKTKILSRPPLGHPLQHLYLRGHELAEILNDKSRERKSSYHRRGDMEEAIAMALNSDEGRRKLEEVCDKEARKDPDLRVSWHTKVPLADVHIGFGSDIAGGGYGFFSKKVLAAAGFSHLTLSIVLEVRTRNDLYLYPHIHTCYPYFTRDQVRLLVETSRRLAEQPSHGVTVGYFDEGEYDEPTLVNAMTGKEQELK
ncbi:hypothetical protein WME94_57720 [Sorangium sp. So ce429]